MCLKLAGVLFSELFLFMKGYARTYILETYRVIFGVRVTSKFPRGFWGLISQLRKCSKHSSTHFGSALDIFIVKTYCTIRNRSDKRARYVLVTCK